MKCLAITNKGLEKFTSLEIKEKINKKCDVNDSCVIFKANKKEINTLCYRSQSINRLLLLFSEFTFKNETDFYNKVSKIEVDDKLFKNKTFACRCIHQDDNLDSKKIEKKVGEFFFKTTKSKVNLEKPNIKVIVFINSNKAYVGLDTCGIDLSKRSYKIFLSPKSLKGTVAYGLLRYAGYTKQKVLLDAFSTDGVMAIEAAMYATGFPLRFYDKDKLILIFDADFGKDKLPKEKLAINAFDALLPNVEKTKKNAKIAGVEKAIHVSKVDTEWLDTKLDEKGVDIICSYFPEISKRTNPKIINKTYKEFFYQADFILKDNGVIVALLHNPDNLIEHATDFKVVEQITLRSGQDTLKAVKLQKKTKDL